MLVCMLLCQGSLTENIVWFLVFSKNVDKEFKMNNATMLDADLCCPVSPEVMVLAIMLKYGCWYSLFKIVDYVYSC